MSVTYLDNEYFVKDINGLATLNLSEKGIRDIAQIKGLETLTELQVLKLSRNQISEIKGLDTLKNLVELDLSSNIIAEIKGLTNQTKLRKLNLKENRFINIEGFENLINIEKIKFGFGHWNAEQLTPAEWVGGSRPKMTLVLHGSELTELEKNIVKGDAKKVVAYCRVRLKQAGYAKRLVPANKKIEKYEKQILTMIKDSEKKVQKAMRKAEMAKRQKFTYDPALRGR
ncbi:MAG: leucine-rich repeat domain-containing protein [Candidatus Hermodarchaeota archaeon]